MSPKCKNISRLDPAAANQLFKQHLTRNTIQQLTEVDSHKQQINFRVSFKSISTNYVSTQSMEYLRRSRGLNSMLNITRGRERERGSQEPFVPAKLRLIPARSLRIPCGGLVCLLGPPLPISAPLKVTYTPHQCRSHHTHWMATRDNKHTPPQFAHLPSNRTYNTYK